MTASPHILSEAGLNELAEHVLSLRDQSARKEGPTLVGITGPPVAGKSTLCGQLSRRVEGSRVLPLDGYLMTNAELAEADLVEHRGMPHTFKVDAFLEALDLIRQGRRLHFPVFDRDADEPVWRTDERQTADARTTVVFVEGSYLLLDLEPWVQIRPLLDTCWFLDADGQETWWRMISRYLAEGIAVTDARRRVATFGDPSVSLIERTRSRADRVLNWS